MLDLGIIPSLRTCIHRYFSSTGIHLWTGKPLDTSYVQYTTTESLRPGSETFEHEVFRMHLYTFEFHLAPIAKSHLWMCASRNQLVRIRLWRLAVPYL